MNFEVQPHNTELWESTLGVLPVRLFPSQDAHYQKYIMLNGNKNNFGLDQDEVDKKLSPDEYRNYAWSSDVDSFIDVAENNVSVYRWNKNEEERYPKHVIFQNVERFYAYLQQTTLKKENAIVPYAIRTFRSLRNYLDDDKNGNLALQAFLYLLAVADEKKEQVDTNAWGLSENIRDVASSFPIERFLKEFLGGLNHSKLRPDVNLILRHAAGRLFQEAHYEALLTRQLNISGITSPNMLTTSPKYGSVHFTPSYIARSIVEESLGRFNQLPLTLSIFDPACGSGEFLKESLRQLKDKGYKGNVYIKGWDISEPAIAMASFLLAFEKREWGEKLIIDLKHVDDSLIEGWGSHDLILMNPPFFSWEMMEPKQRDIVIEILGHNYKKSPNLASAFLWKAVNSLKELGILGCVLPSSLLNANSYTDLRKSIQEITSPLLIAKLGNYIFQSAFTDASIFITHRSQSNAPTKLIWTYNTANSASDAMRALRRQKFDKALVFTEKEFSIYSVDDVGLTWMPMKYESWSLKNFLLNQVRNGVLKEAREIFNIRLGARIGNPTFLLSTDVYEYLGVTEKKYFRPAVLNKAIKNGKLQTVSYLFYPKGKYLIPLEHEEELPKYVPFFYENYLRPNKDQLLGRSRTDENNWWQLKEAGAWQYDKNPKLVSTEFGRAGSFAFDESGDYAVERGLAWLPKYSNRFTDDIYYAYVALFCCTFFNELLAIHSVQLASGWDLSKRYVQNIPIPDFTSENTYTTGEFKLLVEYGIKLSKGILIQDEQLTIPIKSLYGFS